MCPPPSCPKCKADMGYNPQTGECSLCRMQKLAQELYDIRVEQNRFPLGQIPFPPKVYL